MKLASARRVAAVLLAGGCVVWAFVSFNWSDVAGSLARIRVGSFAVLVPLTIVSVLVVRALRWLAVLRVPITFRSFWHAALANGVSVGLATVTPLQLGEFIRARLLPPGSSPDVQRGVASVLIEKAFDLICLGSIGLAGWFLHAGRPIFAIAAVLTTPACSILLVLIGPRLVRNAPARVVPYLEAFGDRRVVLSIALLTSLIWGLNTLMWWIAAWCIHVPLSLTQTMLLIASVMLAIVATAAPGGLGVSEVTTKGVLVWTGLTVGDAEAVAITMRLLTPALVIVGLTCAAVLKLQHMMRSASAATY